MKIKNIVVTSAAALVMSVAIGMSIQETAPISEAHASGETYYFRSTSNEWAQGTTVVEGGDAVEFTFTADQEFKFAYGGNEGRDVALGSSNIGGNASGYFGNSNGNIKCNVAGSYNISIENETIYIDFTENASVNCYYVGTGNDAGNYSGSAWTEYTTKPVTLNGGATSFTFVLEEQFGFKVGSYFIGQSALGDLWFNSFDRSGNNVYVRYSGEYNVSISASGHGYSMTILPKDGGTATVYALDLFNHKLNTTHKAHTVHKYTGADSTEWEIGTTWTGADMSVHSGRIYSYSFWDELDKVNFNSGSAEYQTGDLSVEDGMCFVLENRDNWSGRWISLEAAEFIDGYMKFNSYNETENTGSTSDCGSNYSVARTAYNKLSSDAVRLDVLKVPVVASRLNWWAKANFETLDDENGTQLIGNYSSNSLISGQNNSIVITVVAVCVAGFATIGGYFLLRKKRQAE